MPASIEIPFSRDLADNFYIQADLFRMRFSELWKNWESLRGLGIELGGHFQNKGNGKVGGSSCGIDIFRLKGFYLDFRFFYANDEPTNYFKMTKSIGKFFSDDRVRNYLKGNNRSWNEAGVLEEWHGFNADKLLNIMFNGELFHGAYNLQESLSLLKASMNDELAHHLLTFTIYNRMLVVHSISWALEPLEKNNPCVQIPINYA